MPAGSIPGPVVALVAVALVAVALVAVALAATAAVVAAAVTTAPVAAAATAAPATAHGGDAPNGTNYRTRLAAVDPPVPGLTVRVVEAGARLELVNRTGRTVVVLGYQGEPYLEVRPDGVFANVNSPATYLNATREGTTPVPATANPAAAPSWRRLSARPEARWHDHRTMWMDADQPPQVAAAPGRPHRVRDWTVPLRDNLSTVEIRGTLEWLLPPPAGLWWALTLALAAGVALLGRAWDRRVRLLGWLAVLAGLGQIGYAVAREVDAGNTSAPAVLAGLASTQVLQVLVGLAAIAAAGPALRRRPVADLALGLAGASLALVAGAANAVVFSRSVAPVPGEATWARLATAAVIATGAGLAAAAALHVRRAGSVPEEVGGQPGHVPGPGTRTAT